MNENVDCWELDFILDLKNCNAQQRLQTEQPKPHKVEDLQEENIHSQCPKTYESYFRKPKT